MAIPPLQSARLELRPCSIDDIDLLHALWTDPDVRRYLLDDRLIDRAEARQFVEKYLATTDRGYGMWLIAPRGSDDIIGFVALYTIAGTEEAEFELLYGLAPSEWGRGLAIEASRVVIDYGFDVLDLPRIWARTDPPNAASLRVIEKLGMRPAKNPGSETLPIVAFVLDRAR